MKTIWFLLMILAMAASSPQSDGRVTKEDERFSPTVGYSSDIVRTDGVFFVFIVRKNKSGGDPYFLIQGAFTYTERPRTYYVAYNEKGDALPISVTSRKVGSCYGSGCRQADMFDIRLSADQMLSSIDGGVIALKAVSRDGAETMIVVPRDVAFEVATAAKSLISESDPK